MPTTDDRRATRVSTCDRALRAAIATHLDLSQGAATDTDRTMVQMTPYMHPDRLWWLSLDAPARRATCTALEITPISRAITASV